MLDECARSQSRTEIEEHRKKINLEKWQTQSNREQESNENITKPMKKTGKFNRISKHKWQNGKKMIVSNALRLNENKKTEEHENRGYGEL